MGSPSARKLLYAVIMRFVLCCGLLIGCNYYPHGNCTPKVRLEWTPSACPDPSSDRIRFTIEGDPHEFRCNDYLSKTIDATAWVGRRVYVEIDIVDASGMVLAHDQKAVNIFAS